MSVSSCVKFGWHLSGPSVAEADKMLQRHSGLTGNERN